MHNFRCSGESHIANTPTQITHQIAQTTPLRQSYRTTGEACDTIHRRLIMNAKHLSAGLVKDCKALQHNVNLIFAKSQLHLLTINIALPYKKSDPVFI
jgi:hypothetical protein